MMVRGKTVSLFLSFQANYFCKMYIEYWKTPPQPSLACMGFTLSPTPGGVHETWPGVQSEFQVIRIQPHWSYNRGKTV